MQDMHNMTIGEVARQTGVRTSTLRYYEEIGLLPAPSRVNGQRRYDAGILQSLALIHVAQQAGFTVAEIQVLLNSILTGPTVSAQCWHNINFRKLKRGCGISRA